MPSAIAHYLRARTPTLFASPGDLARGPGPSTIATFAGFQEKISAALFGGRLAFMPYLDPYTEETAEMHAAYRKLLRHPVVKAALLGKIYSVSSLDVGMSPASEEDRDQEISEFCLDAYTRKIEGGFAKLAETILLHGLLDGQSVSEKVWATDLESRGRWQGKRFYRDLKAKENTRLKCDQFKNITAVGSTRSTAQWSPSDFVIFRNLMLFEGAGISDMRAVWAPVWMLDTIRKLRMIHLEKFTSPYFKGTYTDKGDVPELEAALEAATARSWVLIPARVQVEAMTIAASGPEQFAAAEKDLKEDAALAISGAFLQMLTATGGGGDMRGNATTQKGTAELFVWRLSAILCNLVDRQMTPELVDENYAGADYPSLTLGGINYTDLKNGIDLEKVAQGMGFQLSKKAFAKKYGLQEAADPTDVLAPAPVASPFGPPGGGGFGGGLPGGGPGGGGGGPSPFGFADPGPGPTPRTPPAIARQEPRPDSDVGLGGPDGRRVARLLTNAQRQGVQVFADVTRDALTRLLARGPDAALNARRLFSTADLGRLADQLAATNATAELMGRARIAERAAEVEKRQGKRDDGGRAFSDAPTTFRAFDDSASIPLMGPAEALDYFRRLYPQLGVDPLRWGPLLERQAFTLALASDEVLLNKVQDFITERLRTGEGVSTAVQDLNAILDQAGVSPRNPGYAENVFRTNAMDAYTTGSQRELTANAAMFPVWKMSNPDDGRSRPEHAARNGKIYPTSATFQEVRGTDISDVAQCRCVQIPVDKFEWADLQAAGAAVEPGYGQPATAAFSDFAHDSHDFAQARAKDGRFGTVAGQHAAKVTAKAAATTTPATKAVPPSPAVAKHTATVAKIKAKVTAAKVRLDKLKADLKAATGDLKAARGAIKTGAKAARNKDTVAKTATSLADLSGKLAAEAKAGKLGGTAAMKDRITAALGKASAHQVAAALKLPKSKTAAAARVAIVNSISSRAGSILRVQA